MTKKPTTVAEYLFSVPAKQRVVLAQLRDIIRRAAPLATERISYSMPFYDFHGRLAYFALASKHIGLYIPPPTIAEFSKELADYTVTKSAIHLTLDQKLPAALITKLIKARAKYNKNLAPKTCSRGHVFRGPGPCSVCWPGRLKKKK